MYVDSQAGIVQLAWVLMTEMLKVPAQTPEISRDVGSGHTVAGASVLLHWVHELTGSKLTWMYLYCTTQYQHCCSFIFPFCAGVCLPVLSSGMVKPLGRVNCDFERRVGVVNIFFSFKTFLFHEASCHIIYT